MGGKCCASTRNRSTVRRRTRPRGPPGTPIRDSDTEVRAAGALTGARYGVCVECASQRNSLDCKPAHRRCLHYLSIRVDYRVAQWCRPSRCGGGGAGRRKSRNRARDGDTSDRTRSMRCAQSSNRIVATWPHRAQRPSAQSDLLLPNLQCGTRSLYPSTPSGTARL